MINLILKDLVLWLFGLFLDLMNYCADALLGLMNTDLAYFESNVPIIVKLYGVFVAIGWGFLIGNCALQCLKAMFAGLGFETESPAILLVRTFLFGFLLIMSKQVCEIGLSIGKTLMELIGLPEKASITFPDDSMFPDLTSSWLLIVIIGVLIGSQLIKLFFEIGERYVVVAILTLFSPVAFAMGGSRSTKDICSGFVRTYASMILLLVSNVLFLKLIYSALSSMPDGVMILPWTVLIVGIARVARKADNLLSKIGLNPSFTGDPLGNGTGRAVAFMAARSILSSASHSADKHSNTAGKNKSEFKADNTGNTHNRSNASSRNTAHNSSRANARINSNVNAASNAGVNNTVRNSSSVNSADFGKTAVTGTNLNRFGGSKNPGQKGDARVDNKNTAGGRNAANTARNTVAVGGGKKNNIGAQKYSSKYTGSQKFVTQKRVKNTAWKPDKSFSHNPAGKRFGQTDTPPETKPEKAVENEPKQ
ncbi:MAG TPA: hypothetical protein DDY61_00310 [Ruminococcaceae bacterium]|nr:hypothetical protein [Oscillospiraceae bacterium]